MPTIWSTISPNISGPISVPSVRSSMIPFTQELEHIRNYRNIEKVRFGDKLALVYEIGPDGSRSRPDRAALVENAIKHGIRRKNGDGTVVSTLEDEHSYMVEVLDDGASFDPAAGVPKLRLALKISGCACRRSRARAWKSTAYRAKEPGPDCADSQTGIIGKFDTEGRTEHADDCCG